MKNSRTIGILGKGQVGSALYRLMNKYFFVLTKDQSIDNLKDKKVDILHICIPYSKDFIEYSLKQIELNKPDFIIINSTVKPGVTREIYKKTKVNIVHSPVMGIHPRLYYYLFQFPKFIGPVNKKSAELASKHFKFVGLKTIIFNNPEETELAKLLDTTYYGINIVFSKWVKQICDKRGLDFDNVYNNLNKAYNEGYSDTLPNVQRPILNPTPGKIGGNCVVPNAKILNEFISNKISKLIQETK